MDEPRSGSSKMEGSSSTTITAAVNGGGVTATAHLKLLEGNPRIYQDVITLYSKGVSIGRNPDCEISWRSMEISRNHADLEFTMGKWGIRDLSRNGVFVNGKRTTKHALQILKGGEVISFSMEDMIPLYKFAYGEPPTLTPKVPVPEVQSEPANKILEFMEEEMACAVCQEILIDPATICCGHTFCSFCLEQLIGHRQITCPICRQVFTKLIKQVQLRNLTTKLFGLLPEEARTDRQRLLDDRKTKSSRQPSSSNGNNGLDINVEVAALAVAPRLEFRELYPSSDEDENVDVE